jgi:hypothetical protein
MVGDTSSGICLSRLGDHKKDFERDFTIDTRDRTCSSSFFLDWFDFVTWSSSADVLIQKAKGGEAYSQANRQNFRRSIRSFKIECREVRAADIHIIALTITLSCSARRSTSGLMIVQG